MYSMMGLVNMGPVRHHVYNDGPREFNMTVYFVRLHDNNDNLQTFREQILLYSNMHQLYITIEVKYSLEMKLNVISHTQSD